MITPADLARMLSRAADDAGDRTQIGARGPEQPSTLLYSTASSQTTPQPVPAQLGKPEKPGNGDEPPAAGNTANTTGVDAESIAERLGLADAVEELEAMIVLGEDETEDAGPDGSGTATPNSAPTPRMMPQRRSQDTPATFASLDAQELPVVREYSAGGLIFDERGRVAIIARHSRSGHLEWCLPKGHIEKGETPEQTAVREVHEETGILGEVIESIATIDYWFTGTSQRVHKLVHHYALKRIGGELTVEGDPDHEAEDAIWVDFRDLDDVLSYPNERKIAWLYARKTKKQA